MNAYNFIRENAAILFLTGAVCFVLSDTLLALNKFYAPFPYAAPLVMLTYCAAQYLITKGFIKSNV